MKKHNCIVPSEVGWVEVELDNSEIDFLWKSIENKGQNTKSELAGVCLLYTSPSPRDGLLSRMPSSA